MAGDIRDQNNCKNLTLNRYIMESDLFLEALPFPSSNQRCSLAFLSMICCLLFIIYVLAFLIIQITHIFILISNCLSPLLYANIPVYSVNISSATTEIRSC